MDTWSTRCGGGATFTCRASCIMSVRRVILGRVLCGESCLWGELSVIRYRTVKGCAKKHRVDIDGRTETCTSKSPMLKQVRQNGRYSQT